MDKIIDLDTSIIITSGNLKISGYLTRMTPEIYIEVNMHGNYLKTGTYVIGDSIGWKDYTFTFQDDHACYYEFKNDTGTFNIMKIMDGKSSYVSLCGNPNHNATVVIFSPLGRQYGICEGVKNGEGDFSMINNYIFDPQNHDQFRTSDKCLGQTLKNIVTLRN